MERDIDMRQAVEVAAKLFADRCRINNFQSLLDYPYDDMDMINAFEAGAEWQAKQSPWINAKDKLPDDEDLVITGCWCTDYFKYLQQGWYCRECNEWHDTNGDEICVTHWMPIPDLEE